MIEGSGLLERWSFVHHVVQHHGGIRDGNMGLWRCSNLSPSLKMLPRLPAPEVIHPRQVERIGRNRQIKTARRCSPSAQEILVGSNELISPVGVNFQVASNDKHAH